MNGDLPQRLTESINAHSRSRRNAGGAATWLIVGLLLLTTIAALTLWGSGRRGHKPVSIPPIDPALLTAEATGPVDAELSALGDLLGQVMENKRDVQPLVDRIDVFLASHPDSAAGHMLKGQALMYGGRLAESIEAFERSLELEPRQAQVHSLAGTAAMMLNQDDRARHHYEQALSIEPDNGPFAVFLANVQQKLDQDDQAVMTLLTALRRDSTLHEAYALLSDIYAKENKLSLAMDQIKRAIESTPADQPNTAVTYALKRAALLRRDNQPAESLAVLDALPSSALLRRDVQRDTATSWAMLGKPAMAAELYERVLTIDPSNDHAAAEAAHWWLKADNPDAARKALQALRRINPRSEAIPDLNKALQP